MISFCKQCMHGCMEGIFTYLSGSTFGLRGRVRHGKNTGEQKILRLLDPRERRLLSLYIYICSPALPPSTHIYIYSFPSISTHIGSAVCAAISRTTSSQNRPGVEANPSNTVGFTRWTVAKRSSLSYSLSASCSVHSFQGDLAKRKNKDGSDICKCNRNIRNTL